MILTFHDRTNRDWNRALQLINKTNQFNLNGVRLIYEDISSVLNNGGRLFTATLDDQSGSHGEIIACLINRNGRMISFVMSCRVFQRRVEYAFLYQLLNRWQGPLLSFEFAVTERNEPIRNFFTNSAFDYQNNLLTLDNEKFLKSHIDDVSLFDIREA